jgi:putative acetyltransferase
MPVTIIQESPDAPDAVALIAELDALVAPLYPAANRHGYSVDKLLAENIPFFVLRADGTPAACAGIKLVGGEYGEVKRMYVRPSFRRQGFATRLLDHLAAYAVANGIDLLRLETGIHQYEAIILYERYGFHRIPPFPPYIEGPIGLCYEKRTQ